METSLILSMANAFMPSLSIGSHASLAGFLLLMCLKKNLFLLFMSLQIFYQNLLWHTSALNLPVLVALSDTLSWTGLHLYEGSPLALNNFLYLQFSYPNLIYFRIGVMHLMRASDMVLK